MKKEGGCEKVTPVFSKRTMSLIFAYVWDNRVIKVGSMGDFDGLDLKELRGIVLEILQRVD